MAARETAQNIGPMIAAGMLPVVAEVQSLREQVAAAQREQMAKITEKFSETEKSLADLAGEEDITRDVQDGLWRAGVETLSEQMRDLIVCGLVGDLPEAEREGARAVVARCFNGRWGKAIVAGISGSAMHLGALNNYGLPLLSPETTIRLSREFRILGIAAGSKEVIDRAATFLNGGLSAIGTTLSNLNKLGSKS